MVFGCLRRCGMNSSDDDLVPYEKAPREIARLDTSSPLTAPTQTAPLPSPSTHTPQRKMTYAIDHNDSFVPLLCSTKMIGSTGHTRSASLHGDEGSFRDLLINSDRCRSFNHLDDRPTNGRLLRHDHYSTEKFMSTSTVVPVDPSKIAGDRTRETKEESAQVAHPTPLDPVITVIRGPHPMRVPSGAEKDENVILEVVDRLITATVVNEGREEKENGDRSAIGDLLKEMMNNLEKIKEEDLRDSEWRETPLLNQSPVKQPLSPIVEERKWKVYEDEDDKGIPISSTPLSRFSSKRANKLKIRDDVSPSPIDRHPFLKTPQELKVLQQEMKTPPETEERKDPTLMNAPRPLRASSRLPGGVTFNGSRVLFIRDPSPSHS